MKRFLICLILIASLICLPPGSVSADSSGPNSPAIGANDAAIGSQAWTNPTSILSSDNVRATNNNLSADQITNYLKATDFDFALSGNATINGIQVEFEVQSSNCGGNCVCVHSVRLVKGGTISGSDLATSGCWPVVDAYKSEGGPTELWGLSWTPADVNSTDFGFVLAGKDNSIGATDCAVDHMRVTVFFTLAGVMPRRQVIMSAAGRIEPYAPTLAELLTTTPTAPEGLRAVIR